MPQSAQARPASVAMNEWHSPSWFMVPENLSLGSTAVSVLVKQRDTLLGAPGEATAGSSNEAAIHSQQSWSHFPGKHIKIEEFSLLNHSSWFLFSLNINEVKHRDLSKGALRKPDTKHRRLHGYTFSLWISATACPHISLEPYTV